MRVFLTCSKYQPKFRDNGNTNIHGIFSKKHEAQRLADEIRKVGDCFSTECSPTAVCYDIEGAKDVHIVFAAVGGHYTGFEIYGIYGSRADAKASLVGCSEDHVQEWAVDDPILLAAKAGYRCVSGKGGEDTFRLLLTDQKEECGLSWASAFAKTKDEAVAKTRALIAKLEKI